MKFAFIAKHGGIWAVDWMCEALGVLRGGLYAWLARPADATAAMKSSAPRFERASSAAIGPTEPGGSGAISFRKAFHAACIELSD